MVDYALYKGDEFIDLGSIKELALKHNIKESTVYFLSSKAYKKRLEQRNKDNALLVIKLEEENK